MPLILLLLVLLLPSVVYCQEQAANEKAYFRLQNGKTVYIETRECSEKDERLFIVTVESASEAPVILKSISQSCFESLHGNAQFIHLEKDGAAYIRITGSCGNGASCESDVYKVPPEGMAILHYFSGYTGEFQRVGKYLVTDSRGGCCSWEYFAYDLTVKHSYPIGEKYDYSIHVRAVESTEEGAVLKSECTISNVNAVNKLIINNSPPSELLKFCEHYGGNYVLAKAKRKHRNKQDAP